jgi:hypothetical protein
LDLRQEARQIAQETAYPWRTVLGALELVPLEDPRPLVELAASVATQLNGSLEGTVLALLGVAGLKPRRPRKVAGAKPPKVPR